MEKKKKQARVMTPVGILSYPYLVKPHEKGEFADGLYKADLFITKADFQKDGQTLAKAVVEAAREGSGNNKLTLKDFRHPLADVATLKETSKASLPAFLREGHIRLRAKGYNNKPFVIKPRKENGKIVQLTDEEAAAIKGGDFARFYVSPFWYTKGEPGVALYLHCVQFVSTGEAIGQGREAVLNEIDEIEVPVDDISLDESLDNALAIE